MLLPLHSAQGNSSSSKARSNLGLSPERAIGQCQEGRDLSNTTDIAQARLHVEVVFSAATHSRLGGTAGGTGRYFLGTRVQLALLGMPQGLQASMGSTVMSVLQNTPQRTRAATRSRHSQRYSQRDREQALLRIGLRHGTGSVGRRPASNGRRVGEVAAQTSCCGCHWLSQLQSTGNLAWVSLYARVVAWAEW